MHSRLLGIKISICDNVKQDDKLTSIISSNVIHESLRPQHVLGINGEITFNGLDTQLVQRTFVGKHMAIIGDSTLMRFYIHLYALIKLMIIEEDSYVMNSI